MTIAQYAFVAWLIVGLVIGGVAESRNYFHDGTSFFEAIGIYLACTTILGVVVFVFIILGGAF